MEKASTTSDELYENYVLIDVGAYLTHRKYQRDLDQVVQRAKDAGVTKVISLGMSINASKESLRLSHLYPDFIYCAVGVHPHESRNWADDSFDSLLNLAENPECVAIGECGLDYNREFSSISFQKKAFESQVQLACQVNKPLLLHERDAFDDMIEILDKYRESLPSPPGVIHCFTGSMDEAKKYIEMGFCIGVTGYVCKDRSDNGLRAFLQSGTFPQGRLLIESDAPYMFPNIQAAKLTADVRDKITNRSLSYLNRYCTFQRNEPCSLPALIEIVAGLLGEEPSNIAITTAFNSLRLFALSGSVGCSFG